MSYHSEYKNILVQTLTEKQTDNERTNDKVSKFPRVATLLHKDNNIPIVGGRKVYLKSAAAEVAWYLSGTKDCTELNKYTKMWTPWQENNLVDASYGYRWRSGLGVDQIKLAIDNLRKDPSSRRVYINTWDANFDTMPEATNVPCPVGFNLNIINNKLNMQVIMRSSDLAVGLVYDTISFRMLNNILANTLAVETGDMEFVLLNAHIYGTQRTRVASLLTSNALSKATFIDFANDFTIDDVANNPDTFINDYVKLQDNITEKPMKMPVAI